MIVGNQNAMNFYFLKTINNFCFENIIESK